ncbi:MAG: polysaccharide biosynthesis tyrosine autokinase [Panacibacter sp.]
MTDQQLINPEPVKQPFENELKQTIYKYLRYWYWFVLAVGISVFVGYLYLRYTIPVYSVSSKILIKSDKSGGSVSQADILSELDIFSTKSNVGDEVEILKTRYIMRKVVEELGLNINYIQVGNIKSTDLYKKAPFKINILSLPDSLSTQQLHLKLRNDGFNIFNDSLNERFRYNDTVSTHDLIFTVELLSGRSFDSSNEYIVSIGSIDAANNAYAGSITAAFVNKQSNVIQMTLSTTVPKRGEDILNKLYEVYTRLNQEDKNQIADSTINFINQRLILVANELSDVEKNVEQFKLKNNVSLDIKEQSQLTLSDISDVQKRLIQQEVEISVVESIQGHIKGNSYRVVPGALVIQDPSYISLVEKYNTLVLEHDKQLQTSKADNPIVISLAQQIENVKADLQTSLANIKQGMLIARDELVKKNNQLLGVIKTAPSKERAFMDISRQQEVKQQLYLYLLQKREETAISKSGTLANTRLIEPARSNPVPFLPDRSNIYLIAFVAGFFIPFSIIYLVDFLNNRVTGRKEIISITNAPIIGEIGHNTTGEVIVAKKDSRTGIAEQFRAIRTNLEFILKGKEHQVVMLTSSMSGEGKSFLSINLAASLAIAGKKVALVELDLRKPKIAKAFGLEHTEGFSNFMISEMHPEKLPVQTAFHANLFLVSSGPIPPNPAELLLQEKMADLFNYLRENFDYIIVDTPPVGLVTDAILSGKYADACIYIIRQKFTFKRQVEIVNDIIVNSKIANLSILINDVSANSHYGYGYGYGYSYGYSYGYGKAASYYSDEEKPSFFKKFRNKR